MTGFAFAPDDGPVRLIRYVDALPGLWVATFDKDQNLVTIDKPKFDGLSKATQEEVLRTQKSVEIDLPTPLAPVSTDVEDGFVDWIASDSEEWFEPAQ